MSENTGRMVIPKALRHHLGLQAGGTVELVDVDGGLELRPIGARVWIEERDGKPVAVTDDPGRPAHRRGRQGPARATPAVSVTAGCPRPTHCAGVTRLAFPGLLVEIEATRGA